MIKKLSNPVNQTHELKRREALKNIKGGKVVGTITAIICSTNCEDYCGDKYDSDGKMWVGWRDL